jgi:TorA maturation chaperone TorD
MTLSPDPMIACQITVVTAVRCHGWMGSAGVGMTQMQESGPHTSPARVVDEIDRARAQEYALLATLLARSPGAEMIGRLAQLGGNETPLGVAHAALGEAAVRADEAGAAREFFDLFTGLGQGELLPYASHYMTGSLYGRPLARLRETLQRLGIERAAGHSEPEDHVAILCEIMAGLINANIASPAGSDRAFFDEHLAPWLGRFFADLAQAQSADFYRRVGSLGVTFVAIETQAFALPA